MSNAEIDDYLGFLENTVEQEHQEAIEAIKPCLEPLKEMMERIIILPTKNIAKEDDLILDEFMKIIQSNFDKLKPETGYFSFGYKTYIEDVIHLLPLIIQTIQGLKHIENKKNNMSSVRQVIDETIAKVYFYLRNFLDQRVEYNDKNTTTQKPVLYNKLNYLLRSVNKKSANIWATDVEEWLKGHLIKDLLKDIRELQKQPAFSPTTKV